jgi:hypothetical protein
MLQAHAAICEALHQLILKENRFLKSTGRLPDESILAAKRAALAELSASLTQLRLRSSDRLPADAGALATKAQQIVLKALLVDRENEQLLLKCTVGSSASRPAAPRPLAAHLQRAYASSR